MERVVGNVSLHLAPNLPILEAHELTCGNGNNVTRTFFAPERVIIHVEPPEPGNHEKHN